jgi:hypothetical protein
MRVFRQFLNGVLRSSDIGSCVAPVQHPRVPLAVLGFLIIPIGRDQSQTLSELEWVRARSSPMPQPLMRAHSGGPGGAECSEDRRITARCTNSASIYSKSCARQSRP